MACPLTGVDGVPQGKRNLIRRTPGEPSRDGGFEELSRLGINRRRRGGAGKGVWDRKLEDSEPTTGRSCCWGEGSRRVDRGGGKKKRGGGGKQNWGLQDFAANWCVKVSLRGS